ncbi:MAG: outer rane lipid asymmetry maintenance protein MlaD [Pseudomonadota bacterium]|jgi:phospholipid/cholesterol/gamma-HCH transport system substrate-binding protein
MQRTINLLVGLFVLLGLVALVFLSLKVSNLMTIGSGPSYTILANFDDIGGLKPRAAVRSAGVVVGRVREIGFDDKRYQAVVTLDIQEGVAFPKDSSAQILTAGLLGEKYIGILPGAETEPLKNNDRIKLTQSAVVLENIISQFLYNRESGGANQAADGGIK